MSHVRQLARDGDFGAVLSAVLRLIRVEGRVHLAAEFRSPWGVRIDGGELAQFHIVLAGQCWLTTATEQRRLGDGDSVLFPWGAAHALSDRPDSPMVSWQELVSAIRKGEPRFQQGEHAVRVLSGRFAFDRGVRHPLLAELPGLIHTRGRKPWQAGWPEIVAPILATGAGHGRTDTTIEGDCLEGLLIEVLRACVLENPPMRGFLAAVTDRRLARALDVIQSEWQRELSLERLARAVGMSRANLASRFKEVLGVAPMAYLTAWRMQQARELLIATDRALIEIASLAGYGSESAFSRAFRREFGHSPGRFRRSDLAPASAPAD
jgi:AraC-like DNA-binding protein